MAHITPIRSHELLIEGLKRHIKHMEVDMATSQDPRRKKKLYRDIRESTRNIKLHEEQIERLKTAGLK